MVYEDGVYKNEDNPANRYYIGSYRHAQPMPKGNLYGTVRRRLGLTMRDMARAFGVSNAAWGYRERTKRMYHIAEICALYEASGLTARQFINLLKDIA